MLEIGSSACAVMSQLYPFFERRKDIGYPILDTQFTSNQHE